MIALILFIAFGLVFSYFATLNTALMSINFGIFLWESVPLYIVILSAFGVGIVFAAIFYAIKMVSTRFSFGRTENELSRSKKELTEMVKKNHQLELELARLKVNNGEDADDDSL